MALAYHRAFYSGTQPAPQVMFRTVTEPCMEESND